MFRFVCLIYTRCLFAFLLVFQRHLGIADVNHDKLLFVMGKIQLTLDESTAREPSTLCHARVETLAPTKPSRAICKRSAHHLTKPPPPPRRATAARARIVSVVPTTRLD